MDKKRHELLGRIRLHWYSYIARGGYNVPSQKVGVLEKGGIEHWTYFLQQGRKYAVEYKSRLAALSRFLPEGMIMLLTGESRHEFKRRRYPVVHYL